MTGLGKYLRRQIGACKDSPWNLSEPPGGPLSVTLEGVPPAGPHSLVHFPGGEEGKPGIPFGSLIFMRVKKLPRASAV